MTDSSTHLERISSSDVTTLISAHVLSWPHLQPAARRHIDVSGGYSQRYEISCLTRIHARLCGLELTALFDPRTVGPCVEDVEFARQSGTYPDPGPSEDEVVRTALADRLTRLWPFMSNHIRLQVEAVLTH